MMHPKVRQAIEEIDAAVFNGDTFNEPDARTEMLDTLERWTRELSVITAAESVRNMQHVRTTDGPERIARGAVDSMGPIAEHVPYATPIDGSPPACIGPDGRTVRDKLRDLGMRDAPYTPRRCWRCEGELPPYAYAHEDDPKSHVCDEGALSERLLVVTHHAAQRCMAGGRKLTIDPVGIGYLAGSIEQLYYDGDAHRRMDLQIEWQDPMLRALGRVRVRAFGVDVVYPPNETAQRRLPRGF